MPLTKETCLSDVYKTVSPEPLMDHQKLEAFYRPEIVEIRGDVIARMKTRLLRAQKEIPFKAFLMGHPGVGKSSALTWLIQDVKNCFQTIRFSAKEQLDLVNFKAFDVLLLTITELAIQCAKPKNEGGSGERVDEKLLRKLLDWFSTTETSTTKRNTTGPLSRSIRPLRPMPSMDSPMSLPWPATATAFPMTWALTMPWPV